MTGSEPIFIVREAGELEELGRWSASTRTLELDAPGFPFLGVGRHRLEGDLPWLFFDMAPSGFLGNRFAAAFPELGLPPNRQWSSHHVLRAISNRGEDLTGNLIVGRESRERYERTLLPSLRSGQLKRLDYARVITDVLSPSTALADSSLGGERPKVVLHDVGPSRLHMLLKFTPPLSTDLGRRWSNLYAFESLCALALHHHGIASVGWHPQTFQRIEGSDRAGLLVERFDRSGLEGRRGAATLYFLALHRLGELAPAPEVMASLAADGLVSSEAAATVAVVHAFSAAIGNTDAHLGNYALLFDAEGRARLAPFYDITAMVFAPVADELPDARVQPRTTVVSPGARALFDTLVSLVRSSDLLDDDFKARWFRYVGVT